MIGTFGNTFAKLHTISKPTLAAVQGWCIAGGTDMILNADLIVAGESAPLRLPAARVGASRSPVGVGRRLGLERAKRYLFTGDELTARGSGRRDDPRVRARRRAARPRHRRSPTGWPRSALNQLQMMKWMLNDVAGTSTSPTRAGCSASSSTASPATPRKGSTSSRGLRRSAGGDAARARPTRRRLRRAPLSDDRSPASTRSPAPQGVTLEASQIISSRPAISSTGEPWLAVAQVQRPLRLERLRGDDQAPHARRAEERDLREIHDDVDTRGAGARDRVGEGLVGGFATVGRCRRTTLTITGFIAPPIRRSQR